MIEGAASRNGAGRTAVLILLVCLLVSLPLCLRETTRIHKKVKSPSGRIVFQVRSERSVFHPLAPDVRIYFVFEDANGIHLETRYVGARDLVSDVDDAIQEV